MPLARLLALAALGLAQSASASTPPFHTEPSGGTASIVDRAPREDGDFFGFVVRVERQSGAGRETQRYYVQCDSPGRARPGIWRAEGTTRHHLPIDPGRSPAASERLGYNLWWAVCRQLMQRY